MRCVFGLGLVLANLIACSSGPGAAVEVIETPPPDGQIDPGTDAAPGATDAAADPDAPVVVDDAGVVIPPDPHFTITSPGVEVAAGADVTYCYFFHAATTQDVAIKKWSSQQAGAAQQIVLFQTPAVLHADGMVQNTLQTPCGMYTSGPGNTVWTYSADTAQAELALPLDDGQGQPVGQQIKAGQAMLLQIHFVNTTAQLQHSSVEILAHTYEIGTAVTPAAPFVVLNDQIKLGPAPSASAATSQTVGGTCSVDPAAKFYRVSTRTFRQGVHTSVKDDTAMMIDSTNWQNPGAVPATGAPVLAFSTGKLTYQCDYKNPNGYSIKPGDNAATDEMCVVYGYYFPAPAANPASVAKGHFCLDHSLLY